MQRLIQQFSLQHGSHATRADGMCAMEMVAWLAGEAHSDEPECACPVLSALVRACNDAMPDGLRNQHLRPLVPVLVNSRATLAVEHRRGRMAIDCIVRSLVPAWLEGRHMAQAAQRLRRLPEIASRFAVMAARHELADLRGQQRAVLWVLDRAIEGAEPRHYVAGVVHVARSVGADSIWAELAQLAKRMAAVDAQEPAAGQTDSVPRHRVSMDAACPLHCAGG